jgi:hypothetical protein
MGDDMTATITGLVLTAFNSGNRIKNVTIVGGRNDGWSGYSVERKSD